ncbi:MAG: RusA family crossover junction endodeoxyribonuclease [Pontibacterium sp.]
MVAIHKNNLIPVRYNVVPVPKPRQTQRDRWAQRPCVVRYREFKDQVREAGLTVPNSGCRMVFVLPMPKSWTKKKRDAMRGKPHQQKPDTDNMIKAVLDAVHVEDSQIYHVEGLKFWGDEGAIILQPVHVATHLDGNFVMWRAA